MSDCRHAGTDVPIVVAGHDSEPTIDQYRETHMETVSECGKFKQTLKLDTYVTYSELRELIAALRSGTCENISDQPEGFLCSECGWGDFCEPSHLLTSAKFSGRMHGGPNFCPNCGSKVMS